MLKDDVWENEMRTIRQEQLARTDCWKTKCTISETHECQRLIFGTTTRTESDKKKKLKSDVGENEMHIVRKKKTKFGDLKWKGFCTTEKSLAKYNQKKLFCALQDVHRANSLTNQRRVPFRGASHRSHKLADAVPLDENMSTNRTASLQNPRQNKLGE